MTGPFAVDLAALDQVIDRLVGLQRAIEDGVAEVDTEVCRLQGSWTGLAAEAQFAVHQQWLAGATEMRAGLAALQRASRTAHANYTSAVATNLRNWTF